MCEIAALGREFGDLREEAAIIANKVEAGEDDSDQDGGEENIELALDAVVDMRDAECGALFGFVVLHEQAGDGGAEGGLAGLQGVADLLGGGGIGAGFGEGEHAIDGVPELGEGLIEVEALVTRGRGFGDGGFVLQGVDEVGADAFELRDPGKDGIGFGGVLHVAHGQAEGVEIVLDAEKLEGVAAIAVDEFALHSANAGELESDVGGIGENGEDSDDEAKIEATRGRGLRGRGVWHREKDITPGRGRERRGEAGRGSTTSDPSRKGIRDAKSAPQKAGPTAVGREE